MPLIKDDTHLVRSVSAAPCSACGVSGGSRSAAKGKVGRTSQQPFVHHLSAGSKPEASGSNNVLIEQLCFFQLPPLLLSRILQSYSPLNRSVSFSPQQILIAPGVKMFSYSLATFPIAVQGRCCRNYTNQQWAACEKAKAAARSVTKAHLPVNPASLTTFCTENRAAQSHFRIKSNLMFSCSCVIQHISIN